MMELDIDRTLTKILKKLTARGNQQHLNEMMVRSSPEKRKSVPSNVGSYFPNPILEQRTQIRLPDNLLPPDQHCISEIAGEIAEIENSVHHIRLKQRSLRRMVDNYKQQDYNFCEIMARAKKLKESKLRESAALESVECRVVTCRRLKHSSDGSSKSFFEEMEEMGERNFLEISGFSGVSNDADSSGNSSVFDSSGNSSVFESC